MCLNLHAATMVAPLQRVHTPGILENFDWAKIFVHSLYKLAHTWPVHRGNHDHDEVARCEHNSRDCTTMLRQSITRGMIETIMNKLLVGKKDGKACTLGLGFGPWFSLIQPPTYTNIMNCWQRVSFHVSTSMYPKSNFSYPSCSPLGRASQFTSGS